MLTVLPIIPPPSKTSHNSWLNVTRFAKRGLIHAQFQDALIFSSLSVSHINAPAPHVFNTAEGWTVCFHTGLLLKPLWHARVLRWPVNGPIFPWQADSQLWITTWLADEFGNGLSCFVWHVEVKMAPMKVIFLLLVRWQQWKSFLWFYWRQSLYPPLHGFLPTSHPPNL